MKHAHISFRSKPIWISDDERKSAVYEATIPQPFLEAFDPFTGGFGVVRPQAKTVAGPGVDVQFGGYFELFEHEF